MFNRIFTTILVFSLLLIPSVLAQTAIEPVCSGTCLPDDCYAYDDCQPLKGTCKIGNCCEGKCTIVPVSTDEKVNYISDKIVELLKSMSDVDEKVSETVVTIDVHGTEYEYGQDAKVWLQLLDGSKTEINSAICYLDIISPCNTDYVTSATMINSGSRGIYYYDFEIPIAEGTYPVIAQCYFNASHNLYFVDNSWVIDGSETSHDYTATYTSDNVRNIFKEDSNKRLQFGYNITDPNICNISEANLAGATIYWEGEWKSVENDDVTVAVYNHTAGNWINLSNKITKHIGDGIFTNSLQFDNITKTGLVDSTGSNVVMRFTDTDITDPAGTFFKTDYLYFSCDQFTAPEWQEVKGSSEIHISSDNHYHLILDYVGLLPASDDVWQGYLEMNYTVASGTFETVEDVEVEFHTPWLFPCGNIMNVTNSTGDDLDIVKKWDTEKEYCVYTITMDLEEGTNYEIIAKLKNNWKKRAEISMENVYLIDTSISLVCEAHRSEYGLPAFEIPLTAEPNSTHIIYNECSNYKDKYYRLNNSKNTFDDLLDNVTDESSLNIFENQVSDFFYHHESMEGIYVDIFNFLKISNQYSVWFKENTDVSTEQSSYWFANISSAGRTWGWLLENASTHNELDIWGHENRSLNNYYCNYVGGTEYSSGEEGKVSVQFLKGGTPENAGTCNVNVSYPNGNLFITSINVPYLAGSNGIYTYNFTVPTTTGVYNVDFFCSKVGIRVYSAGSFHVAGWANMIFDMNESVMNKIYSIQDDLVSINDTMKNINVSIMTNLYSIHDDLQDINDDIAVLTLLVDDVNESTMNNLYSIQMDINNLGTLIDDVNATTMTKLHSLQDDIISVNDTLIGYLMNISNISANISLNQEELFMNMIALWGDSIGDGGYQMAGFTGFLTGNTNSFCSDNMTLTTIKNEVVNVSGRLIPIDRTVNENCVYGCSGNMCSLPDFAIYAFLIFTLIIVYIGYRHFFD